MVELWLGWGFDNKVTGVGTVDGAIRGGGFGGVNINNNVKP